MTGWRVPGLAPVADGPTQIKLKVGADKSEDVSRLASPGTR
jgi:hypothetical protein